MHYWWIDQICIDQSDTEERSHQVGLMRHIYEEAERVLIWLGTSHECLPDCTTTYFDIARELTQDAKKKAGNELERKVQELLLNPYFQRLWIVQEILLAWNISILVGFWWLEWETLVQHVPRSSVPDTMNHGYNLINNWGDRRSWRLGLRDAIQSFSSMECSDPRDKVYGLLGIIDTREMTVDYSATLQDFLLEVNRAMIEEFMDIGVRSYDDLTWYHTTLIGLTEYLDFPALQKRGLLDMMDSVWFKEIPRYMYSPEFIVSTRFERKSDAVEFEHWWYTIDGAKHLFPCLDTKEEKGPMI